MESARLDNWCVVSLEDAYKAPELRVMRLMGRVYGHPNFEDGKEVVTSPVMHADGKTVFTLNRKYALGSVCSTYREWLSTNYPKINENEPFATY